MIKSKSGDGKYYFNIQIIFPFSDDECYPPPFIFSVGSITNFNSFPSNGEYHQLLVEKNTQCIFSPTTNIVLSWKFWKQQRENNLSLLQIEKEKE